LLSPSAGSTVPTALETVAIIDFETTGMGPHLGARATEVAAVLVRGGQIVDRYQSLMNSGAWVPPFIEGLTGISNAMLRGAPPAEVVMREVLAFTQGCPLVAHNASFDRSFWQAEAALAGAEPDPAHEFACTVLLSRRVYPDAPSHKLGSLADWHHLPRSGRAHRALSDAEVTAELWLRLQADVADRYAPELAGTPVSHALLCQVQKVPKQKLARGIAALTQQG
jgi:DNA polymerase-3 subunit epsilon